MSHDVAYWEFTLIGISDNKGNLEALLRGGVAEATSYGGLDGVRAYFAVELGTGPFNIDVDHAFEFAVHLWIRVRMGAERAGLGTLVGPPLLVGSPSQLLPSKHSIYHEENYSDCN